MQVVTNLWSTSTGLSCKSASRQLVNLSNIGIYFYAVRKLILIFLSMWYEAESILV